MIVVSVTSELLNLSVSTWRVEWRTSNSNSYQMQFLVEERTSGVRVSKSFCKVQFL